MARLAVDGTKSIYFEDLGGAGRALIMIHGWGMDNRCWDGVILPLQSAGHRVITMDHRGAAGPIMTLPISALQPLPVT